MKRLRAKWFARVRVYRSFMKKSRFNIVLIRRAIAVLRRINFFPPAKNIVPRPRVKAKRVKFGRFRGYGRKSGKGKLRYRRRGGRRRRSRRFRRRLNKR